MIEVLFQFPNPFLTPTPDPATLAGGGGGLGQTAGYLAIATPIAIAIGAIAQNLISTRAKIMADTTQATLATLPEMLRFAHEENRDLKMKLEALQAQLNELLPRVARLEAQLDDKTHELEIATRERDMYKAQSEEKEVVIQRQRVLIDEQRATVQRLELLTARATGLQTINEKDTTK